MFKFFIDIHKINLSVNKKCDSLVVSNNINDNYTQHKIKSLWSIHACVSTGERKEDLNIFLSSPFFKFPYS